jgi:Legume lectin domain
LNSATSTRLLPSILTRNGDAALVNGLLRLTPNEFNQNGSAFLNSPFAFNTETSFSTRFQFRIHAQGGISAGDGLVFIIQNDPRGSTALGTAGSGLGYGNAGFFGGPPIANSIGIAFDTYPFHDANQGDVINPVAQSLQNFDFATGVPFNAWIDYNGQTDMLNVFLSQSSDKPANPLLSAQLAIDNAVHSQAFFGFSAATGSAVPIQDIANWQVTYIPTAIPEVSSATALVLMAAMACVILAFRRLRS